MQLGISYSFCQPRDLILIDMDTIEHQFYNRSLNFFFHLLLAQMERKTFLGQKLILVILLLGELHGYKSCIEKERKALLELKKHVISQSFTRDPDFILTDWTNDTKSDCCRWDGIKCSRTSGRVIHLSIGGDLWVLEENSLLNLSLLHPFEEIQSLDLSGEDGSGFSALFDDVEGTQRLYHCDRSWNLFSLH